MPTNLKILAIASFLSCVTCSPALKPRGETPQYYIDPATTQYCTWYHDNADNSVGCADIPGEYLITMEDFLRWNPGVGSDCAGYNSFQSYCVEAYGEPTGGTPTPTPTVTSTIRSSSTSSVGNGITTPLPTQPGMVANCNRFYLVQTGQGCADVATLNGITFAQLFAWNSGVGSNCEGLWANVNVCVGIIGFTATPTPTVTSTPKPTTTTSAGNGIATPTPIQPGMVSNCDRFYFVNSGDGCQNIATSNGIPLADFVKWNPGVKSDCSGMWANAYVCVRTIGYKPPTTTTTVRSTTTTGNGITTPTPTQVGMVNNCNKFYFVKSGDTCASIATAQKITSANFVKWNPAVKSDCTGLWSNTYACVGVKS